MGGAFSFARGPQVPGSPGVCGPFFIVLEDVPASFVGGFTIF